jgi:hypothetical protein
MRHNALYYPKYRVISDIIFMPNPQNSKGHSPKTELDEKFLSIARQIMKSHGINSDRAISLALGRKPDFINRVSNGVQSATAEAWDVLFSKYPEARNITTTNVMSQGGGQTVGTVHGDNHYSPTTLDACQLELEQHKRDLASIRAEVERLQQQVASQAALLESKDALIAAKDDTINLLRASYNRPN